MSLRSHYPAAFTTLDLESISQCQVQGHGFIHKSSIYSLHCQGKADGMDYLVFQHKSKMRPI